MVSQEVNVLLGVCGGIAAYKAAVLSSTLVKQGMQVKVVMTENAEQFVGPITFEAITGNPVFDDMFGGRDAFPHISFKDWAHLLVVAPATANFIGKLAGGIADDLLTTTALSLKKPGLVCPAMNVDMWQSSAVQRNMKTIKEDGWHICGPASGRLACGDTGMGRMEEPEAIAAQIQTLLGKKG